MPTSDEEIGSALEVASSALQRWATRADNQRRLYAGPLPATERWLLSRLAVTGPVRMSTLADWQQVDRSTITTQVRLLEDLGYVKRSPDPDDGRAILISLSEAGRTQHEELRSTAADVFNELISDWPTDERRQFARLLTRFADSLDNPPTGA